MLLLPALAFLLATAVGFGIAASREITRAGRAEQDAAARHRFLSAFDARAAGLNRPPAELLVQTFDALADRTESPRAALRPLAHLAADLHLTRADVEDVALLAAARCDGHLPHGRDLDRLAREVRTVEDLVYFLTPFVEPQPAARAS